MVTEEELNPHSPMEAITDFWHESPFFSAPSAADVPPSGQAHYTGTGVDTYQLIFDITYKMRNLANEYYIYRVNQFQTSLDSGAAFPDGFGAYEFLNYEIQNPRSAGWDSQDAGSDAEMFGLAGFSGRVAFLAAFHEFMVENIRNEVPPLTVAETVGQPQAGVLEDIDRLKARNAVPSAESVSRCADDGLPHIPDFSIY